MRGIANKSDTWDRLPFHLFCSQTVERPDVELAIERQALGLALLLLEPE